MDIPENYKDIESYDVRHGPAIAAFCDKIGIPAIVDKALDCNMDISSGKVVKGLILNTLSGRDPSLQGGGVFQSPGYRVADRKRY